MDATQSTAQAGTTPCGAVVSWASDEPTITCVRTEAHACDRDSTAPTMPWSIDGFSEVPALDAALRQVGVGTPVSVGEDAFHTVGHVSVVVCDRKDPLDRIPDPYARPVGLIVWEVEYRAADDTVRTLIARTHLDAAREVASALAAGRA